MQFDPVSILTFVLLIGVLVIAAFVWRLHSQGVPNAQLVEQTLLKGSDIADMIEERLAAALKKAAAAAPEATLKASYFDRDDLLQDVGRLPATFVQMVRLDGAIVRNGNGPGVDYYVATNGNITQTQVKS